MILSIALGVFAFLGLVFLTYLFYVLLWNERLNLRVHALPHVGSDGFLQAIHALTGSQPSEGNAVELLVGGEKIYAAMEAAIDASTQSVHLETYLFHEGEVGERFVCAFERARKRGVQVRIILDAIGSVSEGHAYIARLRRAGALVHIFHPVRWLIIDKINRRTHRKILVVDGKVGNVGGAGIADDWHRPGGKHSWLDMHVELRGPAVRNLQAAFLEHWIEVTGEVLTGDAVFPALEPAGAARVQVITSTPKIGITTMRLLYALAVGASAKSIDMASAYFIPDTFARRSFRRAVRRGVRVRILVPGAIHDVPIAQANARALYGKLLRRGVELWEYQPEMMHAKVMVVDGVLSTVGSSNFDNRSFSLNDELNLVIYDRAFGATLQGAFKKTLDDAKRVIVGAWRARSWTQRRQEFFARFFRRQF